MVTILRACDAPLQTRHLPSCKRYTSTRRDVVLPSRPPSKQWQWIPPNYTSNKVSGTIRNCCFEADNQIHNMLLLSEFLWPALLLPVAGNKVYSLQDTEKMPLELANVLSHEREPVDDPELRIQALESIYLISLQDAGRKSLWSVHGPRILQVGYEDEEDPKVMEAYEQIGSLLIGNDGSEQ